MNVGPVTEDRVVTHEQDFVLADGRRAAVHHVVDGPARRMIVFCHSAPGSGDLDPDPEVTAQCDVALIGVDRPGYGGTAPMPDAVWVTPAVAADELGQVLDGLDALQEGESVGVVGWSAGGRVALALAARRPDLVDRVAVVATPAPDDQVAWVAPEQKAGIDALLGQPPEKAHEIMRAQFAHLGDDRLTLLGVSDADVETLERAGARERLARMLDEAFAHGVGGLAADVAGYTLRPWGFDLGDVYAKTLLLYGSDDPVAGPQHGKWYRQNLRRARYEQSPGRGHLLLLDTWSRVLSHLAPHAER